jgi:hypothetical protein
MKILIPHLEVESRFSKCTDDPINQPIFSFQELDPNVWKYELWAKSIGKPYQQVIREGTHVLTEQGLVILTAKQAEDIRVEIFFGQDKCNFVNRIL